MEWTLEEKLKIIRERDALIAQVQDLKIKLKNEREWTHQLRLDNETLVAKLDTIKPGWNGLKVRFR